MDAPTERYNLQYYSWRREQYMAVQPQILQAGVWGSTFNNL